MGDSGVKISAFSLITNVKLKPQLRKTTNRIKRREIKTNGCFIAANIVVCLAKTLVDCVQPIYNDDSRQLPILYIGFVGYKSVPLTDLY
jgi:hypothetical protein